MELIEFVVEVILGLFHLGADVADDLRNRNERGKVKHPSEKYVTR
jgi:hypothetical protein